MINKLNATHLRTVFIIQAACVALFVVGSIYEIFGGIPDWRNDGIGVLIRVGVAIGLVLGTTLGWSALRSSMIRAHETERKLKAASNAFMEVMAEHFDQWGLTPAERDVALFSLKGLTVNEIAELRGTSSGTIKAQTNAIYRKAGVSGRPQLLSVFIDDLIQDELPKHTLREVRPTRVANAPSARAGFC